MKSQQNRIELVTRPLGIEALRSVLGDPRGCHVTDTFMASPTVGEKSRDALVKSLQVWGN